MSNRPPVIHGPKSVVVVDYLPPRRRKLGLAYVEGERTVAMALDGAWECQLLFIDDQVWQTEGSRFLMDRASRIGCRVIRAQNRAMERLTDCDTAPPVGLIVKPHVEEVASLNPLPTRLLIMDRIKDPGNAGTLLRAAVSFGFSCVLTEGSVNAHNEKLIRSSAGACFRPGALLAGGEPAALRDHLASRGVRLVGLDAHAPCEVRDLRADQSGPIALVLGSEVAGFDATIWAGAELHRIPINPEVDSLNVAVSGSIAMYELSRFRGS